MLVNSRRSIILAVLGVVAIVVTAGCGTRQGNDTPSEQATLAPSKTTSTEAAKPTEVPSSGPKALTPENAQYLESKLISSDKTEQSLALIPSMRMGKWSSSAVLPAGATLAVDEKSFRVASNGYATTSATVSGSVQGEFILHLALVGDQWLICKTEKKG